MTRLLVQGGMYALEHSDDKSFLVNARCIKYT